MAPNVYSSNQRSAISGENVENPDSDRQLKHSMEEMSNDATDVSSKSPLHYPASTTNIMDQHENNNKPTKQRKHCEGLGQIRFGRAYPCMVVLSVLIYWTFVSLVPIYNKYFFRKDLYPYPIATAGIQLGVVSILLAILNSIQHFFFRRQNQRHYDRYQRSFSCESEDDDNTRPDSDVYPSPLTNASSIEAAEQPSWIFGPHFWWKVKWCFPIGALFGLKYAFTNLGLHLVPAPTHLLLQSTDLVWTVLSAWWINGEVVSITEMVCLAGCVAGSVVLGWQLQESSTVSAPFYAIAINLMSPILLGLCLATLRLACTELMRPDNRVRGTVSAVELTSIKLVVSSVVGLMMACIMEGGDESRDPWWIAFVELTKSTRWGVLGGALLISVFQVNCTFLTFLTSAVSLGLVGQVKIIPQWLLAALSSSRNSTFQFHRMNLVGACLIMGSAAAYALSNWIKSLSCETRCCHSCDEEQGLDDDCTNETEADCLAEEQPLLLLSDANDFGAAVVRKNYCAVEKSHESAGGLKSKLELS